MFTDFAYPNKFLSLSGLQVLVVDDDSDTRTLIGLILNEFSARVRTVTSARDALEVLGQWQVDVLISDIAMPRENGCSLIRCIRMHEDKRVSQIPAIAITAWMAEDGRAIAFESGFDMYVEKPIDPEELAAAIAELVGRE
ncbi:MULTISPECIES: response regulator [Nostocales]|uniref:Response regulator n=3 Tax=Nostocales TaxID=1161 RepID=A0A0C1RF68_9CYAN|nr:response regulator [Tolypothrix bouteillei]KAF3886821.1 response regulator [Tolypothrix bouteillei VB521301]